MRKRALAWAAALLLSAVAGTGVLAQAQRAQMDRPVADFKLRDLMKDDEVLHTLAQYKGKKTLVLTWVSYNCSVSWRYEKRLGKLLQDYGKKDVAFLAVRSSANDTVEGMRKYADARNLEMPVLYDEKNRLADYYNVRITPTFVIIDKDGVMRYRGSFDDDADEAAAKAPYVRNALDAVLGGKQVKTKETRSFG
jgi:peroxiredoxin